MFSRTTDYAIRAMLVLARASVRERCIPADYISDETGTPKNYTCKVLNTLAKAGLVSSMRGPQGGFALARDATDIMLNEIVDLFEPPIVHGICLLGRTPCNPAKPCTAHATWSALQSSRRSPIETMSVADLLVGRAVPTAPVLPLRTREHTHDNAPACLYHLNIA